jgi:diguanylate cyclase (GGDEF)-like protein
LEKLVRLAPGQAWILVLFGADVAILGDLLTGPDVWFGPVYLLIICLATWCLGWPAGQALGLGCVVATLAINGAALYQSGSTDFMSNLALRFVAISTVIAVIAGSRRAYIREWWLARTDPLTGALNRQAFFELSAPLAKLSRWRLMIYADLDGLKQINDARGHSAGDSALRVYSRAARSSIRRDDLFARVGGDEFLIFMAVKDEAAAQSVAARLHGKMNSASDTDGALIRCSLGALVVPPGPMEIDELVRHADNLMYQAKLRGACLQVGAALFGAPQAASDQARWKARAPSKVAVCAANCTGDRRERSASA